MSSSPRPSEDRVPGLVSCVIPVHDGQRFLAEAVDSVLDQADQSLEVIVVDDGSTDRTPEVIASYGGRVESVRQERQGPPGARNTGLARAAGEFVAFQDADDIWMPGKLARQRECLARRPELDLCLGLVQNFWLEEVAVERESFRGHPFSEPIEAFALPCLLARRAAFDRIGGFTEGRLVGDDHDWFVRAREAGARHEFVPDVVLRRRLHRGNLTREDLASRQAMLENVRASLRRRRGGRRPGAGASG